MKKTSQRGFVLVEVLLVIVAVVLLAGAGWYVLQQRNSSKQAGADTSQTETVKSYTDSSKLYTVKYPTGWLAKEASDCCEGAPKDYGRISRSVAFTPADKKGVNGYGVMVQADHTSALATVIEQGWKDNKHVPEARTINGYSVKYVKVDFKGDAENYTDDYYLIAHNGANVLITFREKYYHKWPPANWSASQDLSAFNAIVNSVKFLN